MTPRISIGTLCLIAGIAAAAEKPLTPAEQLAIAEAVMPSLVRVEYTLQYDKGEPPRTPGWGERCPNCGRYHGTSSDECVSEERPLETPGFVLSSTQVLAPDLMVHPRFVKEVAIRAGGKQVKARIAATAQQQKAVWIEPADPLPAVKPLAFDAARSGPFQAVAYQWLNGEWTVNMDPFADDVSLTESRRRFCTSPANSVIVDKAGLPVGVSMSEELPADSSWKGSPLKWPMVSAAEMAKLLAGLQEVCDRSLLRVALSFRSPKQKGEGRMWQGRGEGEDESGTQRSVVGVLLDEKRVLVLANLKPNATARLEKVLVHLPKGAPVAATFAHSLKDYGALVATLAKPVPAGARLSSKGILESRNVLLLAAEVRVHGENRVGYYQHARISGVHLGWKRHLDLDLSGEGSDAFLFDTGDQLLAVPIERRKKVAVQERWESGGREAILTPVAYLREALDDLPKSADPNNVPVTEEQENRLAWMGVELQPLNKELARANNVSDLTRDGQCGALVTYVYPDSPATKVGIEPGFILLRLQVEGQPKPLEIQLEDHNLGMESFPWEQLDQLPEQYFDQVPRPWPPAENSFTRALTDLGFGTRYQAELFHDGKLVVKDLEVTESPRHYDAAARHKSEALGLTVRDLTYEVRRHFQKTPEDPGVIVSKIEPGSKASVAGIKPHEIITRVNDEPVKSVAGFEKLIKGQQELRLTVERMTKIRLVKIKMGSAPKSKPAS